MARTYAGRKGECMQKMPTIPDFPADLLQEHMHWHHQHHVADPQLVPLGYGLEFLRFHRSFIARALAWYRSRGYDPRLVEPWVSVPEPIRQAPCYNREAEARILLRPDTFRSADELGRFIESSSLHGCIHQEAALLYGEPDLNDLDIAPRSTVFYNIHGMIDRWWQNWEGLGQFRQGTGHWCGKFWEDEREVLRYHVWDGSWWLGRPESKTGLRDAEAVSPKRAHTESVSPESSPAGDAPPPECSHTESDPSEREHIEGLPKRSHTTGSAPPERSPDEHSPTPERPPTEIVSPETAQNGGTPPEWGNAGGVSLEWSVVGDSRRYGPMDDGRPFRIWDTDGDGRLEVLFYHPAERIWREGKLRDGKLEWTPVRLARTGQPPLPNPPLSDNASSRRNRNTRM